MIEASKHQSNHPLPITELEEFRPVNIRKAQRHLLPWMEQISDKINVCLLHTKSNAL
jgi:hypothetical protein